MADTFARMRQLVGSTPAWAANNIVLGNGEIGVEQVSSSEHKIKVGDGTRTWSALPYASALNDTINAATQAALDLKLSLSGGTMTDFIVLHADPSSALHPASKQYVDAADTALTTSVNGKLSTTGGTLTGFLTLHADPSSSLHAATKAYVDSGDSGKLSKGGDTATGFITLHADPTSALHAATKQYVDGGSYQTAVGGSAAYANKVVKTDASGIIDSSLLPIAGSYKGTVDVTVAYALGSYSVGDYFAVSTSGTVDSSWNTHITGSPSTAGAGQYLIHKGSGVYDLVGDTTSSSAITGKLDKAGGTMTGFITLHADPTSALHAATKQYADTMLPKAGGTMTGNIVLAGAPSTGLHPATKTYVDTADALAAQKSANLSDLASASTARTNLGATAAGSALFTAADAAAQRTALGATAAGSAVFTAADAAAQRTALGLGTAALVDIHVGTSAPSSPTTGDLWVDTN